MMINVALPVENFKREPGKPVVFFTGDSTVKNADKEEDGMWGWGSQAYTIFNPKKITLGNAARAGRSSRFSILMKEDGRRYITVFSQATMCSSSSVIMISVP